MNNMGISTDPALLNADLPHTLIESPSVSTFLPEEEASIYPLLSNTNGTTTPLTFSHPLTPCVDIDAGTSCNEDIKAETGSSSGSSSGIGMDAPNNMGTTTLFSKHAYQYLQNNNGTLQDANGNGLNGSLTLSTDAPCFVSWNWPLIRKCTFFVFMSSLLAMCTVVVAMIIMLPKTCNPKTAWYRGSVFYEIFPADFKDSNNDGVGDMHGIEQRIDYLAFLGISAVRLNSIFASPHYPDDYENLTSLLEMANVLGELSDMRRLAESLHRRNISLIIDLPISNVINDLGEPTTLEKQILADGHINASEVLTPNILKTQSMHEDIVTVALYKWKELGVDGFYIKGLELFKEDIKLVNKLATWKDIIGKNRVLIISELMLRDLTTSRRASILRYVDLVDVVLDVSNGTKHMEEYINNILTEVVTPVNEGPWVHWSISGIDTQQFAPYIPHENVTVAATLMQLMLPGTSNINIGAPSQLSVKSLTALHQNEQLKYPHNEDKKSWVERSSHYKNIPMFTRSSQGETVTAKHLKTISKMIKLRDRSPSIYKNGICKMETTISNTQLHRSHDDILVVERVYPRRNSFVSVSNFGLKRVTMDLTSMYYSGNQMLKEARGEKVFFKTLEVDPIDTIVIKLDK